MHCSCHVLPLLLFFSTAALLRRSQALIIATQGNFQCHSIAPYLPVNHLIKNKLNYKKNRSASCAQIDVRVYLWLRNAGKKINLRPYFSLKHA